MSTQPTVDDLTAGLSNLNKNELVRGNKMADVEVRCLQLCHSYIGGSWLNAKTVADILVTRISGGFTNQLYRVRLKKHVERTVNPLYTGKSTEPSEVAIKLYLSKHMANFVEGESERLNDMIILTMVSQIGLGPAVYGIFADGFIQAYTQHEQFRAKHQAKDNLKRDVLTLLAKINHLQVPIQKSTNLIMADLRKKIQFGYDHCQVEKLASELDLPTLKQFHVMKEYEELLKRIEELNAPIVFCHNDFRGSNLLVTKDTEQILAIDFEYSGYGTRGFDLACLITEWGKKDLLDTTTPLPTEATVEELTKLYIEECDKLVPNYSQQKGNSLAEHLQEVRLMFLANSMYFLAVLIQQQTSIIPSLPFDAEKQMQFVEVIFKGYIDFKNLLISNGYMHKM